MYIESLDLLFSFVVYEATLNYGIANLSFFKAVPLETEKSEWASKVADFQDESKEEKKCES